MTDEEAPPFSSRDTIQHDSRRVLVIDDDPSVLALARSSLEERRLTVDTCADVRELARLLRELKPHLLVLDEWVPPWSGREALAALGREALGPTVVLSLVEDTSATNELNWLRSGASDVVAKPIGVDLGARAQALLERPMTSMREAYLEYLRRNRRSGDLVVHPGTPFEGRANFVNGMMEMAVFGPLLGMAALDEMLTLENARYSWEFSSRRAGAPARTSALAYPPRVLVVEDEDVTRAVVERQLLDAGYLVDTAGDGREGLARARGTPYDVIITDLAMPVLDGWGMMRRLREDVAAREAAILVLSARDEFRESLRASRAGARAYLRKTGKSKLLLDAVELLVTPRQEAWAHLRSGTAFAVDTRAVGTMWLLAAIAENDACGRLELRDPLGKYLLDAARGVVMHALVVRGEDITEGQLAIDALVAARAEGRWEPADDTDPRADGGPWLFDAIAEARRSLGSSAAALLDELAARPERLVLHEQLAALFARMASAHDLQVLRALRTGPEPLVALAERIGSPVEDVHDSAVELVRRGVIGLGESPDL